MSSTDKKYIKLVNEILNKGWTPPAEFTRPRYEDGEIATAKQLNSYKLKFKPDEVPILTVKRVPLKDPIKEGMWIWQMMSNNVKELQDMGCTVWDEWQDEKGSIGKAYGWQLRNKIREVKVDELMIQMFENKELMNSRLLTTDDIEYMRNSMIGIEVPLNQVDYLLYMSKKNPYSRQIKTTLWSVADLDEMQLPPCVYETHWYMHEDKYTLNVKIRSSDVALGLPYNIYQYFDLHNKICQVSGLERGDLIFDIDIPHIYERHIDDLKEAITSREKHHQPTYKLNKDVKSFYEFTLDDVVVENYVHSGGLKLDIAI